MKGPEQDLQDAAADLLRTFGFLVYHARAGRRRDGSWNTAVEYDGVGFFDLVALRPECPALFIEVKAKTAVSRDQRDWITAGQADGRYCTVLRPNGFHAFVEHVKLLDKRHPAPAGWKTQLNERHVRTNKRKEITRVVARANKHRPTA